MSKQHTLFSFFKKVPSPSDRENNATPGSGAGAFKSPKSTDGGFTLCEIMWAKLDGFPWWPCIICQHPKSKKFILGNEIHVQFFDKPPTRAWVKQKFLQLYKVDQDMDKRNPKNCQLKELEKLTVACKEADEAVVRSVDDRADLLVDFTTVPITPDKADSDCVLEDTSPDVAGTDKENEDNNAPPKKKRKLFVFDSEESEDDYKPDAKEESEEDDESSGVDSSEEAIKTDSDGDESIEETPANTGVKRKRMQPTAKSKKKALPVTTPQSCTRPLFTTPVNSSTKAKLALFKNTPSAAKEGSEGTGDNWPHLKYEFLQPDKVMDKQKRRPDHPDYDHHTLYVPDSFKSSATPGMRQWWEMKENHYDCVLFFKMGKFYELYHMDAVIGVNELCLSFMRGEFAHAGFPEIAYGRFSTILVQKGYKVARVEQTETPDMMAERCRQKGRTTKFDKVVNREICQVTTKGTQVFSFIDGEAKESETNYLLSLTEKEDGGSSTYGVCFIDASIGVFRLGQFTDDKYSSRLRTLVAHHPPVQVIYERSHLSHRTSQLMKSTLVSVLQEPLVPGTEFWTASKTLTTLAEGKYFQDDDWPSAVRRFISKSDSLGLTASEDGELAVKALGACIWYLQQSFLDHQLLSMNKFEVYAPVDQPSSPTESSQPQHQQDIGRYMVIDGISLANLEVLVNSNGGKAGTLLATLDKCCTFSGKRLLRQWICSPLCSVAAITARQAAITELMEKSHLVQETRAILKHIRDLERLLGKIHAQGNVIRSKTHPDSRAIFCEEKIYSKRKIQDFLSILHGLEKLERAMEVFQKEDPSPTSKLLIQCTFNTGQGKFPVLRQQLNFFEEAFDQDLAKSEGCIIPKSKGVDTEYDDVVEELSTIEGELKDYLKSQCQYFGVQVKFFGSDKNRYQLEIPESQVKKAGAEYEFTSTRKGFKRFVTTKTKSLLKRQLHAEETKSAVLKDLSRRVFAQFSEHHGLWTAAVECMAMLDVLMALAEYGRTEEAGTCTPEFVQPLLNVTPFVDLKEGRHPCITIGGGGGFIPNDTNLGLDGQGSLLLLTGPNMGGKSTLMRQLGLITIMAHMGCRVPASSCRLAPVDRIFTRIGAKDDILAGESTFYVELSETALILNHSTRHSLVLVDELGRGTSTYDGTAIAYSVVQELAAIQCRTLFSTHYHSLVEDLKTLDAVSLGHMACMVESDEDDPSEETVTFLYKLSCGACPKSHGFNAAKLAGVPLDIIKVGRDKATLLEREAERRRLFKSLVVPSASEDLAQLVSSISLVL